MIGEDPLLEEAGVLDIFAEFELAQAEGITKLAEAQASEQTLMAISGHVSRRMIEHYSHIRMEAKRAALDSIAKAVSGEAVAQNWAQPTTEEKPAIAKSLN